MADRTLSARWAGTKQHWTHTTDHTPTSYANRCLVANGSGTANGTQPQLPARHGGANQQWTTRP